MAKAVSPVRNTAVDPPQLAAYATRADYTPQFGDYVIWAGWFSTWHGIVTDFDARSGELSIIFAGLPLLLLTMSDPVQQERETRRIKLSKIVNAVPGVWAILQHDQARHANVWYV